MAKKQAVKSKSKNPRQTSWNDMDPDILLKIFASLSALDLVIRISGVCRSWRSLSCEPILWKTTLDLSMFRNYFLSQNLDKANDRGLYFFKIAMNRSSLKPDKLIFDTTPTINDEFLIYAAQSKGTAATISKCIPGLKVFRIQCAEIEMDATEILVDRMVNLEELYLSISGVGLDEPSRQSWFPSPLQDESMRQKVSRLRIFHFCVGYCQSCVAVTEGYSSLEDFHCFRVNL
ncbi:hypothetical protein ACH5RR_025463 [Cinchona calisaya]|uniref:F-box domain-containing protein n=1 Tax=Cinchona calisaya TaxID=153742 RepID=A0ABD2Z094_9GENT